MCRVCLPYTLVYGGWVGAVYEGGPIPFPSMTWCPPRREMPEKMGVRGGCCHP